MSNRRLGNRDAHQAEEGFPARRAGIARGLHLHRHASIGPVPRSQMDVGCRGLNPARQGRSRAGPQSGVVIKLPTYVAGGSLDSLLEQDYFDYARSTFDSDAAHDAAAVRIGIHGSIGPGLGSGPPSVGVGLMVEHRKVGKGHPLHVDKQNMSK